MQTLSEIRQLLEARNLAPQKQYGQCFLVDLNLMHKLVDLADPPPGQTVLEVGAGTGSLSEELLERGGRVVAVEIDRGLGDLLDERLGGRQEFTLIRGDAMGSKHSLAPAVVAAAAPCAHLVSNLPYSIATPLVAQCLVESWRSEAAHPGAACRFERLTFTVQREVADRFAASSSTADYGPVSVLVALLGTLTPGPVVPAEAFWPRPTVASRIVRIDFSASGARRLANVEVLQRLLALAFGQRRKQIGSLLHRCQAQFEPARMAQALEAGGIDRRVRAENVTPEQYLHAANHLACLE